MSVIKQLKNKLLGNIYPITKFNAVYDDNGNKLSDSITNINSKLITKNMFLITTKHYLFSKKNIAGSGNVDGSIIIEKSGYFPVALAGFNSGHANIVFNTINVNTNIGSATVGFAATNKSTTQVDGVSAYVNILWVKYYS